jgi:drug/metabolite transporter (DMT)-like permease
VTTTTTTPASTVRDTSRVGIAATLVAIAGLSMGSTLVKEVGAPGPVVAFWRLAIGTVIWLVILAGRNKRVTATELRRVAPAGLLFGLDLALFFSAVRLTRVANAEFIGALTPVFVVPIAAVVFHEQLRWAATLFGVVALGGVAIILFASPSSGGHRIAGDLLAVFAVLSWVSYLLVTKRVRATIDTDVFMGTVAVIATLVVAPFALATGKIGSLTARGWLITLGLAVLTGTISHGLLAWSQRHVEVSVISILALGQPGLAALWAYLLLNESVRGIQIAGMVLVVLSLGAFTLTARPRSADAAG